VVTAPWPAVNKPPALASSHNPEIGATPAGPSTVALANPVTGARFVRRDADFARMDRATRTTANVPVQVRSDV